MARPSFCPQAHKRARQLLHSLLLYANDSIDEDSFETITTLERLRPHIQIHWQSNQRLVVRTKVRFLERLTSITAQQPLKSAQIREALKRFDDHVALMEDNRPSSQGSDTWHFTLRLWHSRFEIEKNLQQFDRVWEEARSQKSRQVAGAISSPESEEKSPVPAPECHSAPMIRSWGAAPDVSTFHGRDRELKTLEHWILRDRCRLVVLQGMGGIGKTALAVKLARHRQENFDCVVWRTLRNAPPLQTVLNDLLLTFSGQQRSELFQDTYSGINQLVEELQTRRCLLILDNFESLLEPEQAPGTYRPGYEDYGHLVVSVGESLHQSCVLLTSREKPPGLSAKEGPQLPVRSYQLAGVEQDTAEYILQQQGLEAVASAKLTARYSGNPLALKIAIATIQELFDGDSELFLAEETVIFGDIADLLAQQIGRLSALELKIMQWLAVSREPVSLAGLTQKLVPTVARRQVLTALTALQRRSLVECEAEGPVFTQQPVVMECLTDRVIQRFSEVFTCEASDVPDSFHTLAVMEADAEDYIREAQRQVIVAPITAQVQVQFVADHHLRQRCDRLLAALRAQPRPGYAVGNLINLMNEWRLDLAGADFSHLPVWQVYLQDMTLPAVNFTGADLSRSVFTQTLGGFLAVAYHPEGTYLTTAISQEITVWDIRQPRQLFTCQGHTAWIVCLAYSSDGTLIASGSRDQTIRLWNAETGQCLKTLSRITGWPQTMQFSPDNRFLASGNSDGTIQIWDIAAGYHQRTLSGHSDRVLAVKFSADGTRLISSSQDATVRIWDFVSGDCLHVWDIPTNWTLAMDLHPDGKSLVTGSNGKTVKQWDLNTGDCQHTLPNYHSHVWSVAYSPDGAKFLTASDDHTIKLWDATTGNCLQTFLGHSQAVWLAAPSPDGRSLVSASGDQTVKIWDLESGQCRQTLKAYSNWVQSVAFSPAGDYLASSGEDNKVRLWQVATGDCRQTLVGHTNQVSCVVFDPRGEQIASASDDATIRLWDLAGGECLRVLRGHTGWVQSVAFHPTQSVLASGSHDQTARLWDAVSGECLQTLEGHLKRVKTVAFHPSGTWLASGSDDHTAKLWEVDSGVCVQTFVGHAEWVLSVAFHPHQPWLASGSGDRTIKLWDVTTGECRRTLTDHTQRVRSVAFSPDGEYLASCGDDGTLRLWDLQTGQCSQVMTNHERAVWSVAFHPHEAVLASCSEDETVRLWNIPSGECFQVLRPQRPYEGMNITDVVGLTWAQRQTLIALGAVDTNSRKGSN